MNSWNQLDVLIVVMSVVGIALEEVRSGIIPINPTIIRVMRVLRIARGNQPTHILLTPFRILFGRISFIKQEHLFSKRYSDTASACTTEFSSLCDSTNTLKELI